MPAPATGLTASARAVLSYTARLGQMTRPEVAEALSLSKPTVSAAVSDLEDAGLLTLSHTTRGATGRSASVYRLAPTSGYVLGVDAGVTRVRLAAARLDGTVFWERDHARRGASRSNLGSLTQSVVNHVSSATGVLGEDAGALRAVAVAVPHSVVRTLEHESVPAEGTPGDVDVALMRTALRAGPVPETVPLSIENNVNCAALAELHEGCARGRSHVVVLQVGVGIGCGIIARGQLLTGASGVAGEAAMLPFPWSPGATTEYEGLEHHLGSEGLMARVRASWTGGDPPKDPSELFAAARRRDGTQARALVDEHAHEVGRLAQAVVALLDPGLIVLTGGVGANEEMRAGVQTAVDELPWGTRVVCSDLGRNATRIGATRLAVSSSLEELLRPGR
ncbi:ROK family transcriptional regulator [Kineococcus sp. SYSU DK003]|uniref:ROK family transcriptional regulator n=1 Tax=Kineococcus sp. SYSU DK003 TaxID=3383124 RepID=UPI003D7D278C